ncbi:TPA: hypothetical protein DCE37_16960 [Candidatus Latescibacteria bacterium]|nr:hypothetical protein [Candidatus Latescibacterota bacterium]
MIGRVAGPSERKRIDVPRFSDDEFALSEVEVAWRLSEDGIGENRSFRKGDLEAIPMPSRSFRQESSVYLYYDVYNLLRGANGRTRYRVDYEARGGARMPRVDYLRESRDSSGETRTGKSRGSLTNTKASRVPSRSASPSTCLPKATETSKSTSQLQSSRGSTNLPYPVTRN